MAVATISLAAGVRLAADAGALMREPIPWRSRDLSPTNLAALLAAHLGERTTAEEAERVLRDLGAIVNRGKDTLYATASARRRRALGSSPRWSITGAIDEASGRVVRLEVRYLSGK